MKPLIKLNHIANLHDARYCSAVGVGLLGFNLQEGTEHSIRPAAIAEIMDWLSGPEGIGEWAYEAPDEIASAQEAAKLQWVSVPLDYSDPAALPGRRVFRAATEPLNSDGLASIQALATRFPEAHFEFAIDPTNANLMAILESAKLLERAWLRFAEPDPVWTMLSGKGCKPHAFSLGEFVEEPDGQLDYETCDDFVERFEALLPA